MHSSGKKKAHPNLLTHPPNPKNTSPNTLPSPIQKLKVDIFNFLDYPPIEASLGLSTLFWGVAESASQRLLTGRNGQVQTYARTDGNHSGRSLLHRPLPPPPPKTSVTHRHSEFIYMIKKVALTSISKLHFPTFSSWWYYPTSAKDLKFFWSNIHNKAR